MKHLLAIVLLLASCRSASEPAPPPDQARAELEQAAQMMLDHPGPLDPERALAAVGGPRFYEVKLPAGEAGSINIAWFNEPATLRLDPRTWLDDGDDSDPEPDDYDGVRIVGHGVGKTVLRGQDWYSAVAVGRHPGIVEVRGATIHCGLNQGIGVRAGEQNLAKTITPEFQLRLIDCEVVADPPGTKSRSKWLVFTYQCDVLLLRTKLDGKEAVEHDFYGHGAARWGVYVIGCDFRSAGAECLKYRPDATETAYAGPQVRVVVRDSTFRNWYQPWSWRGGAGIVLQGAAANVLVERCLFFGGGALGGVTSRDRSHCVMVSSEGQSYDILTGAVGTGFGNGWVVVRECAMAGYSEADWNNSILRCARNGGSQWSARGFLLEDSGLWGQRLLLQLGEIPAGKSLVRGCNTPEIRAYCDGLGMDTSHEAAYATSQRRVPLSEGLWR